MVPKYLMVRDLSDETKQMLRICNLVVLFYPILACAYSKAIFDCRAFSRPLNRR